MDSVQCASHPHQYDVITSLLRKFCYWSLLGSLSVALEDCFDAIMTLFSNLYVYFCFFCSEPWREFWSFCGHELSDWMRIPGLWCQKNIPQDVL